MATPRSVLLPVRPVWVHVISRCVRKAYLCGGRDGRWEYRRKWVEDRLAELTTVFAVEIAAYAVMSNHVHVVLRLDPEIAAGWSDAAVVARWTTLFGKRLPRETDGRIVLGALDGLAANAAWVAERRRRLADVSWLMRALCEDIARRANAEDGCTGRFWEGRVTSVPLLDQAALIACMAYVDLNPIRARIADRPEVSARTSIHGRIRQRQRHRVTTRMAEQAVSPVASVTQHTAIGLTARVINSEEGLWCCPLARCVAGEPLAQTRFTTDDYLSLVDLTGRVIKSGKRGAIPAHLAPMLNRLDLEVDDWLSTMQKGGTLTAGALGHHAQRATEALRRGLRWVRNTCALFAARPAAHAA